MQIYTIKQSLRKQWLQLNPWAINVLLIVFFVATPLLTLLYFLTEGPSETWYHLQQTVLWDYVSNSFLLMLGVGFLTFVFGVSTAWFVTTCEFPGRKIFEWANILPLAIPTYIVAYTYSGIFNYTGPIQRFFRNVLEVDINPAMLDILNLRGVMFIMAFVLYPYVYVITRTAFLSQSTTILESSRVLGSSASKTFFKIALPIARPAIVAGISLALMEVLNDYGAVKYYGVSTFTTGIFRAWFSLSDINSAIYLSALLMLFVLVLILMERYQRGRARFDSNVSANKPIRRYHLKGFKLWAVFLACLVPLAFGFIIPVVQLLSWSFDTFSKVVDASFFKIVFNSFYLASLAAIVCVVVATLLIFSVRLNATMFIRLLSKLAVLGYSIPGAVIAVGVMIPALSLDKSLTGMLENLTGASFGLLISGTLILLVFAYLVRYLAVAYNPIDAGFKKVGKNIDEASRSLGVSMTKTLWKIDIPLVKGTMLSGALLVFVDVLKELPLTLILRPFNYDTLATKAFEMASDEMVAESSNAALIIIATGVIPIILLSRLISKK